MKHVHFLFTTALMVMLLPVPSHATQLNTTTTIIDTVPETTIPTTPEFTKVIEDLPLMPGLQLVEGEDVLFAEPVLGRIAETHAQGIVDIDDIYAFYSRTLPGMGWTRIDAKNYRRDNDHLRIDAHADGKITSVQFSVAPLSGK